MQEMHSFSVNMTYIKMNIYTPLMRWSHGISREDVCGVCLQVLKIQARSALVSWTRAPAARGQSEGASVACSYELLLADKGCDGKYRVVYR